VVVVVRTPTPNYLRQASQNLGKYYIYIYTHTPRTHTHTHHTHTVTHAQCRDVRDSVLYYFIGPSADYSPVALHLR
jgi:hypothetical protein